MARFSTPLATITHLLDARARGNVEAAIACYEPNATVVLKPGKVAKGQAAIKGFTEGAIGLPITFGEREIIEAGDIALHISQWTLRQTDGAEMLGHTTDVLRRQTDGNWLLALDNPWGSSAIQRKAAL